jgi:urea carboxylase
MDDLSFRLGNTALGNAEGAPGLEFTMTGPSLTFTHATTVSVTGAEVAVTVDGLDVPAWTPVTVPAGGTLDVGTANGRGLRGYILFQGGLDVPEYLGSASTFTLGQFGGHAGRVLRAGDVLRTVISAVGHVPTAARRGCTPPTFTTPPTQWAPWTSPGTPPSCSGLTAPALAASFARSP